MLKLLSICTLVILLFGCAKTPIEEQLEKYQKKYFALLEENQNSETELSKANIDNMILNLRVDNYESKIGLKLYEIRMERIFKHPSFSKSLSQYISDVSGLNATITDYFFAPDYFFSDIETKKQILKEQSTLKEAQKRMITNLASNFTFDVVLYPIVMLLFSFVLLFFTILTPIFLYKEFKKVFKFLYHRYEMKELSISKQRYLGEIKEIRILLETEKIKLTPYAEAKKVLEAESKEIAESNASKRNESDHLKRNNNAEKERGKTILNRTKQLIYLFDEVYEALEDLGTREALADIFLKFEDTRQNLHQKYKKAMRDY